MRKGAPVIALTDLTFRGTGLSRPECVLSHRSGLLFVADWTGPGGVAIVAPDGAVTRIAARGLGFPLRPNGIALEDGGSFLVAHLGDEVGGLYRLHPDGQVDPVLTELDGRPLPPSNFVVADEQGRIWLTISTRQLPRHAAARPDVADGFIVLLPPDGPARIVADGLGYTNECLVLGDGLLVNETFGRALSRFEIRADGPLGQREVVARFGEGTFPDGLTADAEGGLWITSIVSNRVIRLAPDGALEVLIEDAGADAIAETEKAFAAGELGTPLLTRVNGRVLRNISSLAFAGPDLRTAWLGCLAGDSLAGFPSPIPGHPPLHYDARLNGLVDAGVVTPDLLTQRTSP